MPERSLLVVLEDFACIYTGPGTCKFWTSNGCHTIDMYKIDMAQNVEEAHQCIAARLPCICMAKGTNTGACALRGDSIRGTFFVGAFA